MKFKQLPLQKYLHSILDYNPETGIFTWKYRSDVPLKINMRCVGKIAASLQSNGYINIAIKQARYRSHRLAWVYMHGDVLDEYTEIDHKNRIRNDNRINNLRLATKSKNGANSKGKSRSGLPKGVIRNHDRFMSRIMVNHEVIYLGTYDTPELAHIAYCEAAKKYHGEYARAA